MKCQLKFKKFKIFNIKKSKTFFIILESFYDFQDELRLILPLNVFLNLSK